MSNLPKGWEEIKLIDVIASANTGLDAIKRAPIVDEDTGIKCFRIQDASQSKGYNNWGFTNVSEQNYEKFKLKKGDILIARTGNSIGVHFLVQKDMKSVFNNGLIRLRVNERIKYEFLYNIITSNKFYRHIQSIAYGTSTQPNMQINSLLSFKFVLPKLDEQKEIANILSSFDKKIELLKEQNQTLETMAQTIFKEWFVDFNYPNATGEMIDSEMGDIPKGWSVGRLGNEFDITIGRTPPRQESHWFSGTPQGMKWASIKDMGNAGVYIFKTSEYIVDEAVEKFNIPIIPKNTTILSFKMTVGKVSITTEDMLSNEAIAHMKIKKDSFLTSEYIYLFLLNLNFNSLGSTSSIVMAINTAIIKQIKFFISDEITMKDFNQLVAPIFKKIKNNSEQLQSIEGTRDSLLPRLMSGKMRVNND